MVDLVRDDQVWDVFGKELPSDSESGCRMRRKQDSDFWWANGRATHGLGVRKKQQIEDWLWIHHSL